MKREKRPKTITCEYCGRIAPKTWGPKKRKPRFCSLSCKGKASRKILSIKGETEYQTLHRMYVVEKMSMSEIANSLGCVETVIYYRMKELGINRRSLSDATKQGWTKDDGTRAKLIADSGKLFSTTHTGKDNPGYVEKIRLACKECDKIFYRSQAYLDSKKGMGNFCSAPCRAIHTKRNMRHNTPTSIEQAIMDILDEKKLDYEFNYYLKPWVIDFAFLNARLAVEADGIYWHSLPGMIEKDARKDADLASRDWQILRFDGNRIRADAGGCVQEILSFLQHSNPSITYHVY